MLNKAVLTSCIFAVSLLSGCASLNPFPVEQHASIGEVASTHEELLNLPAPVGAIPVSVYSFRDQTGQYKPSDLTSSFSTAVTQGATSILMQALDDSAWFVPVEREGLQNILTERKIARASNEAINKKNQSKVMDDIPPLTSSKIILEGGIISYDSNIRTGGSGLGYYGISASEEYREDQISVYLRAVDVRTGRVLISVNTSKKILSQEMRAGLFRFVSFKELLEAEIGFTSNEPMHICVTQAIEKSVSELVKKGIAKNIWRSAASMPKQASTPSISKANKLVKVEEPPTSVVLFDYGKANISSDAANTLTRHANYLRAHPEQKVIVAGHADERGSADYNMALSKDRATAAAQHLHRSGAKVAQLSVISLGEQQPASHSTSESDLANNRRVEITAAN